MTGPVTDRASMAARVRSILSEVLSIPPESIAEEARIMNDLGAESIDLLDLRFRIEQAFRIKITNRDLAQALGEKTTAEEFRSRFTVRALADYLHARAQDTHG